MNPKVIQKATKQIQEAMIRGAVFKIFASFPFCFFVSLSFFPPSLPLSLSRYASA
jgi:hypothetical protein